jgi:hypothetical protein
MNLIPPLYSNHVTNQKGVIRRTIEKHSSVLQNFVNYWENGFITLAPGRNPLHVKNSCQFSRLQYYNYITITITITVNEVKRKDSKIAEVTQSCSGLYLKVSISFKQSTSVKSGLMSILNIVLPILGNAQ